MVQRYTFAFRVTLRAFTSVIAEPFVCFEDLLVDVERVLDDPVNKGRIEKPRKSRIFVF